MSQNAAIGHQRFGGRMWFVAEHDPAETHLGIDRENDLRQLCFVDAVIDLSAQLLDLSGFFLRGHGVRCRSSSMVSSPRAAASATAVTPSFA